MPLAFLRDALKHLAVFFSKKLNAARQQLNHPDITTSSLLHITFKFIVAHSLTLLLID